MLFFVITRFYGNPTIVGGNYDAETGLFTFEAPSTGTYTIAYVETLIRLTMQVGTPIIFDLAGNAPTQVMDVLPVIQNGRTLVPIRFVAEALGAEVDWTPSTDYSPMIAILILDGRTLMLPIGQITPELATLGMDVPAQVMDGRTMVPLRFVSEFFGALVMWDGEIGDIEIFRNPEPFNTTPLTETQLGLVMAVREDEDETEAPAEDNDL